MKKNSNLKNIILWIIAGLALVFLVIFLGFLSGPKKNLEGDYYKNIESALLKISKYKSYQIKKSEVVLKMIKNEETFDDFAYQIDTVLTRKGNKARIDSYYFTGDSKEYFGGIYVSPKYTEFMYSDDESVYFSKKEIFDVIKTYIPTLSEVCDDFEKVKFDKIKNTVSKSIGKYLKQNGKEIYEDYSTFFDEKLNDSIEVVETKDGITDTYYKLKMNIKDFVKFESEVLIKIKNDKKVTDMIVGVAGDLIKYFEKTKEYEKIRMTEDEFNTLKYNYEEEIKSYFENEMTKRIAYIQTLYSGVVTKNDDKYIELVFRLDEEGNIVSVTTEGVTILDDAVVSNLVNYSISNVNEVKSNDLIPSAKSRTPLVSKSRNELYTIFESIKIKYEEKGVNFFSNLLGLDKTVES